MKEEKEGVFVLQNDGSTIGATCECWWSALRVRAQASSEGQQQISVICGNHLMSSMEVLASISATAMGLEES